MFDSCFFIHAVFRRRDEVETLAGYQPFHAPRTRRPFEYGTRGSHATGAFACTKPGIRAEVLLDQQFVFQVALVCGSHIQEIRITYVVRSFAMYSEANDRGIRSPFLEIVQ